MPSIKQVKIFRFFERLILVMLVGLVITLAGLSAVGRLGADESYAGGGAVLLLIFILYLVQKKIDKWQTMAMTQIDFAQEEAFTSLFERSPVAYIIIETKGTIQETNPAAINLLKGEKSTMAGLNFFDLIQTDSKTDAAVLKSKVEVGLTINDVEVSLNTVSGETVWVTLSMYEYRNSGQRLVSLVDITEQKHIDAAKSEFVALATHQLRTPIAAIRWNVELLHKKMQDTETPEQTKYLTKIERNVLRMISLINDFLNVSKLEMGTYAAEEMDINLTEFFSGIVDEFSEKITEKQIVLNRLDTPPHATIKTDSRLFHIIVSNLVSNAVKYLKPSGALTLSYEIKGEQVEIVVADNGIGIPESEIPQLFKKFFRASNAQSHQTQGTGLGLYVVKQSAELLGGNITVESAENQGARFVVTIPVTVVSLKEIG